MELHYSPSTLARWVYERLVAMVKRCLKHLTLEQFITLLSEIEVVLNSWPLMFMRIFIRICVNPCSLFVYKSEIGIFAGNDDEIWNDPSFQPAKTQQLNY